MPTDKQIDAAANMLWRFLDLSGHTEVGVREAARAALTAAEQAETVRVKVKQLEWASVSGEGVETYQATSATGIYRAFEDEDSAAGAVFAEFAVDVSRFCMVDALSIGRFHSFDAAKAAAQADYEQRILAALEPSEPVTDAQREFNEVLEGSQAFNDALPDSMRRNAREWLRPDDEPAPAAEPVHPSPSEERLREALDRYEAAANHVGGCGDGNCVVVRPIGQHTNGGCRCYTDKMKAQRMMRAGQMLCTAIRAALKEASNERA